MKNCLIFGTGKTAEAYVRVLNFHNIKVLAYIDNDESRQGKMLNGVFVDKPSQIMKYKVDYILICSVYADDIKKQLITDLHMSPDIIVNILDLIEKRNRTILFNKFLQYEEGYQCGLEVGGANAPVDINDSRITVRQVDITTHINSNDGYEQLKVPLVRVDIIDDGEKLSKIGDDSQDFIIACHFIEHCRNPIGTIRNFMKKIHSNGFILLAIPDKRVTFDRERELTDFDHLILDDTEPDESRDICHIYDKPEDKLTNEEKKYAYEAVTGSMRPHFHV